VFECWFIFWIDLNWPPRESVCVCVCVCLSVWFIFWIYLNWPPRESVCVCACVAVFGECFGYTLFGHLESKSVMCMSLSVW